MKKHIMEDELEKIAPELQRLREHPDGFKLPDGYFDTLEDRLFNRIEASGLQQQGPFTIRKTPAKRFWMSQILMAAAAVMALVIAAVWFFKPTPVVDQTTASVELSDEEIENYLMSNVQYFEADQLAMLPDVTENEYKPPTSPLKALTKPEHTDELRPEDVESLLNEMTEEELKEIL